MSARDDLAELLCRDDLYYDAGSLPELSVDDAADAILAAGYSKPRTITTAEELDALGFQSVVLDAYGTPYVCERHRPDGARNEWKPSGMGHLDESDTILYHGPATVLYTPKES